MVVIEIGNLHGKRQPHTVYVSIIFIVSLLGIKAQLGFGKDRAPDE
jgi:hypothetical protein